MERDVLSISGNRFTFCNQKCECLVDIYHETDGTEYKTLLVKSLKETVHFAYTAKGGLVRINAKSEVVESSNVLAELLSVPYDDLEGIIGYISKNEFFIPVSADSYERFSCQQMYSITRRIKFVAELVSDIQEPRKNYRKILSRVCWLTFMKPIELKSAENEFRTCFHSIQTYLAEAAHAEPDPDFDPYNTSPMVLSQEGDCRKF